MTSSIRRRGYRVIEVARPDRRIRRLVGKSDTIDAQNAAKAVMAGFATAEPKTADGTVEMIRQLKVAHDTAVKARATAMVTLKAMLVHAPEVLRAEMAGKTQITLARHCAALTTEHLDSPDDSIQITLATLAHRWLMLDHEAAELNEHIERLVKTTAPQLVHLPTQKNLEKTQRPLGDDMAEFCRRRHISICWTASKSEESAHHVFDIEKHIGLRRSANTA